LPSQQAKAKAEETHKGIKERRDQVPARDEPEGEGGGNPGASAIYSRFEMSRKAMKDARSLAFTGNPARRGGNEIPPLQHSSKT
jgi:hypothetical protein